MLLACVRVEFVRLLKAAKKRAQSFRYPDVQLCFDSIQRSTTSSSASSLWVEQVRLEVTLQRRKLSLQTA